MYVLLSKLSNINRTKHKNFLNLDQQSILLYIKNTYIFCFICCYRPKEKKLDKMNNLLYFFIRASDQQPSLESRNQDLSHGVCATTGGGPSEGKTSKKKVRSGSWCLLAAVNQTAAAWRLKMRLRHWLKLVILSTRIEVFPSIVLIRRVTFRRIYRRDLFK